jgi:hypothetical protein
VDVPVSAEPGSVRLTGEPVVLSTLTEPAASYGKFRLENRSDFAVRSRLEAGWLEAQGERRPLDGISLFDADRDQPIDGCDLEVAAGSSANFLVGFPRVPYEPSFEGSVAVAVRLVVDGDVLEARSPIQFVRRIPLEE